MNQFEKTAFLSLVENMEAQLRSFKKMIAMAGDDADDIEHRTFEPKQQEVGNNLSDDQEERLSSDLEKARLEMMRTAEISRIASELEKNVMSQVKEVASEMNADE